MRAPRVICAPAWRHSGRGNLRAAVDWACGASGDRALACHLLARGWLVWYVCGASSEGLQRMLELWPLSLQPAPEIAAEFGVSMFRCHGGSARDEIVAALRRSVTLYRQAGDADRLTEALIGVAVMGVLRNDQVDTQDALDEVTHSIGTDAPVRKLALLASVQGAWAWRRGDYADALLAFDRQANLYRAAGLDAAVQMAINNRCGVLPDSGDYANAVALAQDTTVRLRGLKLVAPAWGLIYRVLGRTMLGDDDDLLPAAHEALVAGRLAGAAYQPLLAAALYHARRGELQRAALVGGHARKMRAEQKFYPVTIDLRMEALLRETLEAAQPRAEFESWLAAGELLSEDRVIAIAFEQSPCALVSVCEVSELA